MSDTSRRVTRQTLWTAPRFQVERVTYALRNGQEHTREIVRHPGAVVILPRLDDGRICLIKNYRVAVNQVLLELPAGTRETNEPPDVTAKRELTEETGFSCNDLRPLGTFFMSPGILEEQMFAFLATGLTEGQAAREIGEEMENVLVTPGELELLLSNGEIRDSKTLSTLLLYSRYSA